MKKKLFFLYLVFLSLNLSVFCKTKKISSFKRLSEYLMKNELVVVFFYDYGSGIEKEKKEKIKLMKKEFKSLDDDYYKFDESDILFLYANLSKDKHDSLEEFCSETEEDLPVIKLYKDGKQYLQGANKGTLAGILSGSSMKNFIMDNFEDFIDEIIKEKDEERERKIEKQKLYYRNLYVDPFYSYHYDYPYSWPYYYGHSWRRSRPGFHFGVSI